MHVHLRACAGTHAWPHAYAHAHVCEYMRTPRLHMQIQNNAYVNTLMRLCMCMCMCMCVFIVAPVRTRSRSRVYACAWHVFPLHALCMKEYTSLASTLHTHVGSDNIILSYIILASLRVHVSVRVSVCVYVYANMRTHSYATCIRAYVHCMPIACAAHEGMHIPGIHIPHSTCIRTRTRTRTRTGP